MLRHHVLENWEARRKEIHILVDIWSTPLIVDLNSIFGNYPARSYHCFVATGKAGSAAFASLISCKYPNKIIEREKVISSGLKQHYERKISSSTLLTAAVLTRDLQYSSAFRTDLHLSSCAESWAGTGKGSFSPMMEIFFLGYYGDWYLAAIESSDAWWRYVADVQRSFIVDPIFLRHKTH